MGFLGYERGSFVPNYNEKGFFENRKLCVMDTICN